MLLLHFIIAFLAILVLSFHWNIRGRGQHLSFADQVTVYLTLLIPVVGEVIILIEILDTLTPKKS